MPASRRLTAFTLIELLIVVVIIGLIATLVVVNTNATQVKARDASRRNIVDAYSTALEQLRTASVTKSYFVQDEGQPCNALNPNNTDPKLTGYGYMAGQDSSCVGFNGGGAGRMTRKGMKPATGGNYPSVSIVDALKNAGYLNTVQVDPRMVNQDFSADNPNADFILTTCDKNGYAASNPADAVNYSIFANLEQPETKPVDETTAASHQCGGSATGKGWDTVNPSVTVSSGVTYNYARGSQSF